MIEIVNISISGNVFILERDAYQRLKAFIQNKKEELGEGVDSQLFEDDVARRLQYVSRVSNRPLTYTQVDMVISQMLSEDDLEGSASDVSLNYEIEDAEENTKYITLQGGNQEDDKQPFENIKRESRSEQLKEEVRREKQQEKVRAKPKKLYRNPQNSIIGGVCSGLGDYFNIHVSLFRLLFLLPIILGWLTPISWGFGSYRYTGSFAFPIMILYFILWIVLPRKDSTDQKEGGETEESLESFESEKGSGGFASTLLKALAIVVVVLFVIGVIASLISGAEYLYLEKYIDWGVMESIAMSMGISITLFLLLVLSIVLFPPVLILCLILGAIFGSNKIVKALTTIFMIFWLLALTTVLVLAIINMRELTDLFFMYYD